MFVNNYKNLTVLILSCALFTQFNNNAISMYYDYNNTQYNWVQYDWYYEFTPEELITIAVDTLFHIQNILHNHDISINKVIRTVNKYGSYRMSYSQIIQNSDLESQNRILNFLRAHNINIFPKDNVFNVIYELYRNNFKYYLQQGNNHNINVILNLFWYVFNHKIGKIYDTLNKINRMSYNQRNTIRQYLSNHYCVNVINSINTDMQYLKAQYDYLNTVYYNDCKVMNIKQVIQNMISSVIEYLNVEKQCLNALGFYIM
ncbi:MAG: hypothetical protein IJ848_00540 [Alphaproteobacteria bacterium]|nr:hypothetical protein [Alphaproteobacteria bacterium]